MKMRPMSLWGSGDSTGSVSLSDLFLNQPNEIGSVAEIHDIHDIAFLVCRGGWPECLRYDRKKAIRFSWRYYDAILNTEMEAFDGVKRDRDKIRALLSSYSRHIGTSTPNVTIAKDMEENEGETISPNALSWYLNVLRSLFVIDEMKAWNPRLRSKTAIRTAPTRYFTDLSIATAAKRVDPDGLIWDLKAFGFLFENLSIRNLRVYMDGMEGNVYHYRDRSGLECDAVLTLPNRAYALVEIKLGGTENINKGAENLKKVRELIDVKKMSEPRFMMVLVGVGRYAYRRDDGIYVVPVTCLKD